MHDVDSVLDEILRPISEASPEGEAAANEVKKAVARLVSVAEGLPINWAAELAGVLPRLVRLSMGIE